MKNVLLLFIVLIVALSGSVNAQGKMSALSTGAVGEVSFVQNITKDTLSGATDSTVFLNKFPFEGLYEYVILRGAATGTAAASDSVKIRVRIDYYDYSSNFLYSENVDSITATAGENFTLPVNKTALPTKATVKGLTYTGSGGQVITGSMSLWKRLPLTRTKNY